MQNITRYLTFLILHIYYEEIDYLMLCKIVYIFEFVYV